MYILFSLAQNTDKTTFAVFKEVSHVLASMLSVNNLNPTVAQGFSDSQM